MTKRVMVVDDSMIMRTLLKDIVSADSDLEVVGDACDGEVALQKAKELKPDLILLDIEMPKMNGVECLKRLKLVSSAKVIIISSIAQAGSQVALDVKNLGAADVIPKPSGATSLDIKAKKGHEITKTVRRVLGLAG
ncbi:MAG: response regulator [Flavobacteriales bacterium]|nr:response regulator [Flavobacteriales bacterium]